MADEPGSYGPLVEEPADVTPAWEARSPGPEYPVHDRPEVRQHLDRLQTGHRREIVARWLTRAGRYLGMIRDVLVHHGLPEELAYTAMIESGFNPVAVSRAGARGLWQFMSPTARRYGLRVDRYVDERLDPEKATWAAAAYLKDLYGMFGSWHLAQAAYNAGEMRVARALERLQASDFWALTPTRLIAEETKHFVAAIQAAVMIGREPERYGFAVVPEEPLRYESIQVPPGTTLKRLAAVTRIDLDELQRLNASLRLGQTPPHESWTVKVPAGSAAGALQALERETQARTRPRVASRPDADARLRASGIHVVKPRETVDAIARRYGVTVAQIARWNGLTNVARIHPGDRLRVGFAAAASGEDGQGGFR